MGIIGIGGYADTNSVNVDGRDLLVVNWNYASTYRRRVLYAFLKNKGARDGWHLLFMRDTNTSSISIDTDIAQRRVVFRSKAGKALMILPFETINLTNETDEQ